jgi:thiosulfate dehydrogenase
MATRKTTTPSSSSGFLKFLLGFVCAFLVIIVAGWAYLKYGSLPVATADRPFPFEKQLVHLPLNARVDRELQQPPFAVSEDVYEAGAHVYKQQCAACHGAPGQTVAYARWMYPVAPALWQKHSHGNVVGVSDDDPGETFWKIKNGIRLSGMPSYENLLSNDEMWDVALLLKNADQQLPDPVRTILTAK